MRKGGISGEERITERREREREREREERRKMNNWANDVKDQVNQF